LRPALPLPAAGPRKLEGPTAELFRRVVSSPWRMMFPGLKPSEPMNRSRIVLAALASVASLG
jgi:hypothetical protein